MQNLTEPELIWDADFDKDNMKVYMRHSEDFTQIQLMVKFSFQAEFQDVLVGLATMVDDLAQIGKDPFLIHKADKGKMQ